ncbi:hypothetical protein D1165_16650 [Muribaculaceae bacterium M3]|nr:hypothetical protein [Muribaculaceae bacterium M3]
MLMTSCSFLNPGPVPEDIIGDQPGELQAKINELLDQAGTDSTKVEFAEISSSFLYNPGDNTANVHVQIISPDDKNKMVQYSWSDMKDRRNMCEKFDLTVSTFLDNDVVDSYDGYKEMLFTYDDARKYLNNLPTYCKEALEASGYKDNGYIDNFTMSNKQIIISVKHKDGGFYKTYNISKDGEHIVIPE